MGLYVIFLTVSKFLQLVSLAILIYCVTTWIAPRSTVRYWLERIIQPFCAPFRPLARAICTRWGCPVDVTCWFAILGIELLDQLLWVLFSLL